MTNNAGVVVDELRTVIEGVEDLTDFFRRVQVPWYDSRREMYDSRGDSTETPWPGYGDTPEHLRYIWAKGAILGLDGPAGDDDILRWGGPARLHAAVTGESSEAQYTASSQSATIVVDVPYASHHDEGTGIAPEWAWPGGDQAYQIPRRRLLSPAGTFTGAFARTLGEYMGQVGARFGLRAAEAQDEIKRAFRMAAAREAAV